MVEEIIINNSNIDSHFIIILYEMKFKFYLLRLEHQTITTKLTVCDNLVCLYIYNFLFYFIINVFLYLNSNYSFILSLN